MHPIIVWLMLLPLFAAASQPQNSAPLLGHSASEFHRLNPDAFSAEKTALCLSCHIVENDFSTSDTAKWLRPKSTIDGEVHNIDESRGTPDAFSKACLICHDGSTASLALNAPLSPCGLKNDRPVSNRGENHPVFMEYREKPDLQGRYTLLNGQWEKAEIVGDLLRNEKIVCISCHLPHHNSGTGYLRTSMRGSALCLGCHKK